LDANVAVEYRVREGGNGLYVFVIEGTVRAGEHELNKRDALGVTETGAVAIAAVAPSEILLIEVPMG